MLNEDNIFWVACPQCERKFYCDNELRNSGIKLHCPFCHHRFLDTESPHIFEFRGRNGS